MVSGVWGDFGLFLLSIYICFLKLRKTSGIYFHIAEFNVYIKELLNYSSAEESTP